MAGKQIMKYFGRAFLGWSWLGAVLLMAGCAGKAEFNPTGEKSTAIPEAMGGKPGATRSNTAPVYYIRVGDELQVTFPDAPPGVGNTMTDQVKEDGTITLLYNQRFTALSNTPSQLERSIQERYVTNYFRVLTVNVRVMNRTYSVGGEVRAPGNFGYAGQTKILDAINSAGGFTDFASHTVLLTRSNGDHEDVDCNKARNDPKLNKEIFPGDSIFVRKKWL
jgi:protein involved in polysaccharide export with SLBB domain